LRILYTATDVRFPSSKGSSTHTYELASCLAKLGNQVHVIVRRGSKAEKQTEDVDSTTYHRVYRGIFFPIEGEGPAGSAPKSKSFKRRIFDLYLTLVHAPYCAYKAIGLIKKFDIEIVLERASSLGAGAIAALLCRKPVVLEVIDRRHTRFSAKISQRILAYGRDVLKVDPPPDRLRIVSAAANTELFAPQKSHVERDLVGYVGSFRPWHGVEDIVEAAAILARRGNPARFRMVGPGYEQILQTVRTKGLSSLFEFTGPVEYRRVPELIRSCTVVLAPFDPSRDPFMKERGFIFSPLKIFEYMSLGKAIVATDVEKVRDALADGRTAILVKPRSPPDLATAIELLIEHPPTVIRLGRRARAAVAKSFSWERLSRMVNRTLCQAYEAYRAETR